MSIPGSASPLFLSAAAAAAPAGYEIERSLRFNSADSAYLSRTMSSASSTYTLSMWVKRSAIGTSNRYLFSSGNAGLGIRFTSGAEDLYVYNGATATYSNVALRDLSAWYHIVFSVNSLSATIYVNNSAILTGASAAALSTTSNASSIGRYYSSGSGGAYFDGYLADVHFIDGQALAPTDFGETDSDNNWNPKTYSGTYGTNGFHLDFSDNSSNAALGDDSSGNNNDWTVNNISAISAISLPGVAFSTGNLITAPSSADFNLGTGDFTIEYWLKRTTLGNNDSAVTNFSQVSSGYLICLHAGTGFSDATLYLNGSAVVGGGTPEANVWNHYAYVRSGTTCTLYKNGTSVASATSSAQAGATNVINIGAYSGGSSAITGQMSNVRIVKGVAVYTSNFTPSTQLTNVSGTVLLCCQSSSSVTAATVSPGTITTTGSPTAGTFSDTSPNQDSLVDSPTNGTQADTGVGNEVVGNYCTLNPLKKGSSLTFANGNLDQSGSGQYQHSTSTFVATTGKWYFEVLHLVGEGNSIVGLVTAAGLRANEEASKYLGETANGYGFYANGQLINSGSLSGSWGNDWSATNNVIGCAFDADTGKIWFSYNGTWQASGNPATGANPAFTASNHNGLCPAGRTYLSGQLSFNFGQRAFAYGAPSGFKALCTANLTDPTIADGSTAMDATLWNGDNTSPRSISGYDFSPDLVWIKCRSDAAGHMLFDTVRGNNKVLRSMDTSAEVDSPAFGYVSQFNSDGFTLTEGTFTGFESGDSNMTGRTYVGWAWDAGTSTVTNTDGSITSSVRANASAGFSVVSYSGNGTSGATVGHGLNAAPGFIILKRRDSTGRWAVYYDGMSTGDYIYLDLTDPTYNDSGGWPSLPTSSVFSISSNSNWNNSSGTYIAYCFAPVDGYSSFGSYTGNGSADGPFVYTGFRPKFLLLKSAGAGDWVINDTSRDTYNVSGYNLYPNDSTGEGFNARLDILSNGFKLRSTFTSTNPSSTTVVFAAFAESPFAYARAR